jgi:hypothetical protein
MAPGARGARGLHEPFPRTSRPLPLIARGRRSTITSRAVPGFLPSSSGFRFANSFPKVPVRHIGIPGVLSIPIGDASNGLCGGMAFAVRDYFESHREIPADATAPAEGALFDYLVDRLFDSFNLPFGPVRYLELMSPRLPDAETLWSRLKLAPHGRSWQIVNEEWPKIRDDIDGGHPSPLGLVEVKSTNPFDLKENHQVLAFGYELVGSSLTLNLYDPNSPGRDDVVLSLSIADPVHPVGITMFPPGRTVYAMFRATYVPSIPP